MRFAVFVAGAQHARRPGSLSVQYEVTDANGNVGDTFADKFLNYVFQMLFDAGEKDAAADELMRAYMGAGAEIFEEDDPKYFKFLKTKAKI